MRAIEINSNFHLGSKIPTKERKSFRLVEICQHFKAQKYYSPIGSKDYIEKEDALRDNNIEVIYQNLRVQQYKQAHGDNFISQLSIIDLMANLGAENSKIYINGLHEA